MIKEIDGGLIVTVKILPNAKRNEIIKTDSETKIKITAQPVEGKANKAVIEFLSKTFKISKTSIEIIKGETSKEKNLLFKTADTEKIIKLKEIL